MTVNDMLILVRQRLGDMNKLTFSDAELMYCLNTAMDELCTEMAAAYSPELLKEFKVTGETFILPEDFITWQGQYPLNYAINDSNQTVVTPLGPDWDGENPTLKYFASKKHLSSMSDEIPFRTLVQQNNLMKKCVEQIRPNGGGSNDSQGAAN